MEIKRGIKVMSQTPEENKSKALGPENIFVALPLGCRGEGGGVTS